jgi:hypothetical protein
MTTPFGSDYHPILSRNHPEKSSGGKKVTLSLQSLQATTFNQEEIKVTEGGGATPFRDTSNIT